MADKWLTTQEAARLSGYTRVHVRRLVTAGHVRGQRFGQAWQVSRSSLLAYVRSSRLSADGRRGPG